MSWLANLIDGIRHLRQLVRRVSPTVMQISTELTLLERAELVSGSTRHWLLKRYGHPLENTQLGWHVMPLSTSDLLVERVTFEFLFWSRSDAVMFKLTCGGAA